MPVHVIPVGTPTRPPTQSDAVDQLGEPGNPCTFGHNDTGAREVADSRVTHMEETLEGLFAENARLQCELERAQPSPPPPLATRCKGRRGSQQQQRRQQPVHGVADQGMSGSIVFAKVQVILLTSDWR